MHELRLKNGHKLDEVVSALQKDIRRGNEKEALYWAMELAGSNNQQYLWKRLQVIASEDVGLANPQAAILVNSMIAGMAQTNSSWNDVRVELIGHAVLYLCRSPKNRQADDAMWLIQQYRKDGWKPEIPEYALDVHTKAGKEKLRSEAKQLKMEFLEHSNAVWYGQGSKLNNSVEVEGRDWTAELKHYLTVKGELPTNGQRV